MQAYVIYKDADGIDSVTIDDFNAMTAANIFIIESYHGSDVEYCYIVGVDKSNAGGFGVSFVAYHDNIDILYAVSGDYVHPKPL